MGREKNRLDFGQSSTHLIIIFRNKISSKLNVAANLYCASCEYQSADIYYLVLIITSQFSQG
jgi:hypothetical protein